jgi:hypothetical protein
VLIRKRLPAIGGQFGVHDPTNMLTQPVTRHAGVSEPRFDAEFIGIDRIAHLLHHARVDPQFVAERLTLRNHGYVVNHTGTIVAVRAIDARCATAHRPKVFGRTS